MNFRFHLTTLSTALYYLMKMLPKETVLLKKRLRKGYHGKVRRLSRKEKDFTERKK